MNNKYIVTRPVFTEDGACLRRDEFVVHEKDLGRVIAIVTSEPWFSKIIVRKVEDAQ